MNKKKMVAFGLVTLMLLAFGAQIASAHTTVKSGPYVIEIGLGERTSHYRADECHCGQCIQPELIRKPPRLQSDPLKGLVVTVS